MKVVLTLAAITSTLEPSIVTKVAGSTETVSSIQQFALDTSLFARSFDWPVASVAPAPVVPLNKPLLARQWEWPVSPVAPTPAVSPPVWTPPVQQSWAPAPSVWILAPPVWTPATPVWTPTSAPPLWTPTPTLKLSMTPSLNTSPMPSYTWAETHNDSDNTHKHIIIACVIIGMFLIIGFLGCGITVYKRKMNKAKTGSKLMADIEMQDGGREGMVMAHTPNNSLGGRPASPRRFGF